jgi:hypothetical protein
MHNEKPDVERLRGRLAMLMLLPGAPASAQQKSEITLSRQPGIFYMPSHIMEKNKLMEKHAASLGVPGVTTKWINLSGGGTDRCIARRQRRHLQHRNRQSAAAVGSRIMIPAAFGSILTALKIGWAFAWRTLIAAELVFGVSSGQGGLGWFIFEKSNLLDIPAVFAGLLTVIVIGLIVENLIFRTNERNTVQKWGTQS